MGQVAEVVLERRESGDCLALQLEGGMAVSDALLRSRNDGKSRFAQLSQRGYLWLVDVGQVFVDFMLRHQRSLG